MSWPPSRLRWTGPRPGEPAFTLIGGEAGVGKTRLVGELAAQAAAAGFTVLTGQCIELGAEGLPLAPLVDALRTLARTTPADDLADLLGPAGPGLARLLPELVPGAAAPAPRADIQAAQLAELVLGLLGRLAAVAPVMFVVEDLHRADQSTLELLAFLARSLRGVRVLLVGTYRSDELHRRHPLLTGWERMRSVDRIELGRFDRGEVAAQLAAILGDEPGPGLAGLVFDRSGGNAYLVEELAGVVRAGGDPDDLPPSLRDVRTGLDQAEVSGLAAEAAYRSGAVSRSLSLLGNALAELQAGSGPVWRALLLDRRAQVQRDIGRVTAAVASLEEALALLPDGEPTRAHAVVLASIANLRMRVADMEGAAAMASRAVDAAHAAGAKDVEADVAITLGAASSYLGSTDAGLVPLRSGGGAVYGG